MFFLILFAFLGGIVTVLSPCILPLLPIILSSSVDTSGKARPFGVVVGFTASFTFFTLFLASIVNITGIPSGLIRNVSIIFLFVFGLSLLIPKIQTYVEILFSKFSSRVPNASNKKGFWGGLVVGLSLGLLWTPCVGPILASVISLSLVGNINFGAMIITLSYALGTAIPMFIIMILGSNALQKVPWLTKNTGNIQKAFGVLMIITSVGIFFNIEKRFQSYILDAFPNYAESLTQFENNKLIQDELLKMNKIN